MPESNVTNILGHSAELDIPAALEELAERIRSGALPVERVVVICEQTNSSVLPEHYGVPVSPFHIVGLVETAKTKMIAFFRHLDGQGIDDR